MTLLDIVARLVLGIIGLLAVVILLDVLGMIMSRVGKLVAPNESEVRQIGLGFLVSICGVAIWGLGDWLFGILQGAI